VDDAQSEVEKIDSLYTRSTNILPGELTTQPGELTTQPLAGTYFYRLSQVFEFKLQRLGSRCSKWPLETTPVVNPTTLSSLSPAPSLLETRRTADRACSC
jgi:hypothetical protein